MEKIPQIVESGDMHCDFANRWITHGRSSMTATLFGLQSVYTVSVITAFDPDPCRH